MSCQCLFDSEVRMRACRSVLRTFGIKQTLVALMAENRRADAPWWGAAAGSALGGLALAALGGDLGRLGEQRSIARPEHLAGKAHRGFHLREAELPLPVVAAAQAVEQRRGAGLE